MKSIGGWGGAAPEVCGQSIISAQSPHSRPIFETLGSASLADNEAANLHVMSEAARMRPHIGDVQAIKFLIGTVLINGKPMLDCSGEEIAQHIAALTPDQREKFVAAMAMLKPVETE